MKQIIIISEDHPGVMADITQALADAGVNIETLSAHTIGGTGIAIATVDKYDEALQALASTPYRAVSEDAIVVQLEDQPGALARITRRFKDANINIKSVRFIRRKNGKAIVALCSERTEEARELVKDVIVS